MQPWRIHYLASISWRKIHFLSDEIWARYPQRPPAIILRSSSSGINHFFKSKHHPTCKYSEVRRNGQLISRRAGHTYIAAAFSRRWLRLWSSNETTRLGNRSFLALPFWYVTLEWHTFYCCTTAHGMITRLATTRLTYSSNFPTVPFRNAKLPRLCSRLFRCIVCGTNMRAHAVAWDRTDQSGANEPCKQPLHWNRPCACFQTPRVSSSYERIQGVSGNYLEFLESDWLYANEKSHKLSCFARFCWAVAWFRPAELFLLSLSVKRHNWLCSWLRRIRLGEKSLVTGSVMIHGNKTLCSQKRPVRKRLAPLLVRNWAWNAKPPANCPPEQVVQPADFGSVDCSD